MQNKAIIYNDSERGIEMKTQEELNIIKEEIRTLNKDLKNKDLEQVSGGFQFDPEPGSQPKPRPRKQPQTITEPISPTYVESGYVCNLRNKGTVACSLVDKGRKPQCSGCSRNHD